MPAFMVTDAPLLIALFDYRRRFLSGLKRVEFARAMDIGGTARSDHSAGLARLSRLGLVERRQRADCGTTPWRGRASYEYRITAAGIALASSELAQIGESK